LVTVVEENVIDSNRVGIILSFPRQLLRKVGTMSKSLAVKVSTAKLIKALEGALAKREKEAADHKKAKAEYDKEYKEFVKSLGSLVGTSKVTLKETDFRERGWRSDSPEMVLTFTLNGSVKIPKQPDLFYSNDRECEEIRNAIALLKMTDDEYVSANTYKGVAQYL